MTLKTVRLKQEAFLVQPHLGMSLLERPPLLLFCIYANYHKGHKHPFLNNKYISMACGFTQMESISDGDRLNVIHLQSKNYTRRPWVCILEAEHRGTSRQGVDEGRHHLWGSYLHYVTQLHAQNLLNSVLHIAPQWYSNKIKKKTPTYNKLFYLREGRRQSCENLKGRGRY